MSLHVSTLHVFYPPWEPHTLSLSSIIGNNTLLLAFSKIIYGVLWAYLVQYTVLAPIGKGTYPAPFVK